MSRDNDWMIFSHDMEVEDKTYTGFSQKMISRLFWLCYGISLTALLTFVLIITLPIGIVFSIPFLCFSNIWVALFHALLILGGRKGLIYCEEDLDGNVLTITSGVFKPQYFFQKASKSD